ncbi:DUF3551 domain-containing protein [Bradyrhizobium jicamae]|uniref:DUF3551 domain-containing protein n=1 Tax=Bradyrhizobium jicamae TaxID=280332 RepID=UPI001BA6E71F|nr:DUF3551 domain-containing protein [Bradyrhizobium jicamae]MBR0754693.1 DUF3551 domain-containing protein [Bradyrhizobium jicamae]
MRMTLAVMIGAGAALLAAPAQAQTYDPRYPVCMDLVVMDGGQYIDCSFTSKAQCDAAASGRPAKCFANPYFAAAPNVAPSATSRPRQ